MQALPQLIGLQSLESIIDCSLPIVVPETSLLDAISTRGYAYPLMVARGKSVLISSSSQIVGCFTKHEMVLLVASGTSLKTANIFEVMHTSVMTLDVSEFSEIASIFSRLRQQQCDLLPVTDNQGQIFGNITPESISQGLAQKIEKTRDKPSIGSFEVEHQILFERQLLKYKWLLARAIVRKDTTGKLVRLIGVSKEDLDFYCKCDTRVMQTNAPNYHIIMSEILNDVLIIGKSEAGKLEYRPTSFNLVEYSRQLLEKVQMNLGYRRLIYFTSQYNSVTCCMDEKLLGRILTNLLSNAIKYSSDDSIVKFSLLCQHGQAVFEIQYWGIGIPEDIPYLFESFNRASNIGNILSSELGIAVLKNVYRYLQRLIFIISKLEFGTSLLSFSH
ncbi:ATP-binding protein [Nostoc sp. KVJ20]|uniref:ATP-binding protein n=1 Tax=Nostoc sp. KVJ20 TaxID=457944 RepID=UPI000A029697|nr:ATP-binding protein [Nostoc sp. KVJ20]